MSEFGLKAFSSEADVLNKGISRNIPNIFGNTSLDPNTSHSIWNINNWTGGGVEMMAHRNPNKLPLPQQH